MKSTKKTNKQSKQNVLTEKQIMQMIRTGKKPKKDKK